MIRERTHLNLAIGLTLSLLLHASIVVWGPPFSLSLSPPGERSKIEVSLREWPVTPPAAEPPAEPVPVEEPVPPPPTRTVQEKPVMPPNREALQEALQAATADVRPDRVEVQLPEGLSNMPALEPSVDRLPIAQSLIDSLRHEPRMTDPPPPSRFPEPTRMRIDRKELPALPGVERFARREATTARPPAVGRPSASPAVQIKGPASERQVVFQPPLPSAMVEGETEIELRFWILPNGTVSRVIPLKKSDPRLEALAINYLRNWRFSPLPPEAEALEQWGVIPFKFVIR